MKATLTAVQPRRNKYLIPAMILIVLILAGLFTVNSLKTRATFSAPPKTTQISPSTLEEQYGLRLNLLAVTAAGGMVDLRLKMLDGEKAKNLLQDKKNFPTLSVVDSKITLKASEDTSSQEIKFENNGGLFLLFPNNGNAVKPGSKVILVFGDVQLEPVVAK